MKQPQPFSFVFQLASSLLLCTLLLSLASLSMAGSKDNKTGSSKDCLRVHMIHDWKPLNRTDLLIWSPSRKHPYLVSLASSCAHLAHGDSLAIVSNDSRLCGFGGDKIRVDGKRCQGSVTSVQLISAEEANQLIQPK